MLCVCLLNHAVNSAASARESLREKKDFSMDFSTWLAYFAASWAISISPGPGAVFAMSCGLNHGFKRGYVGTLGMILGMMTALFIVAFGLGALLLASVHAFTILKWMGVAYLVYLGIKQWCAPAVPITQKDPSAREGRVMDLVVKGWAVNATNPKGYIFMMAVMPQFIDTHAPLLPQYLLIGATLIFTDVVVMAGYTGFAAKVLGYFKTEAQMRLLNRIFGGLFVAAATALATFKRGA